jgi:hypothetical protein
MDGRKILLLVENYLSHPKTSKDLKNIELFFLPHNIISNN